MLVHHDILDAIQTAIIVVDSQFTIEFMNNTAEDFCGGSAEQFLGKPIGTVFNGDEVQKAVLHQDFDAYQSYTLREVKLTLTATGQRTVTNIVVSKIGDSHLLFQIEPLDLVLSMSKEERIRNVQLASRQLVRGMAHEIKNPLGSIRGSAQLLRKELVKTQQIEYTDLIIDEVDRLRLLVDRLLSPNHKPSFKPVNIHEVLEKIIRIVASEAKAPLNITREYDPSIPPVLGDFDQLTQAFLNIIQNAHDATQEQSAPQIVVRTGIERQFTIGATHHPMVARIQFEDNGTGIPRELQDQIFFPLVTGKPNGTGLGLAITYTIIGMHFGLIVCDSEPGRTSFMILLPLVLKTEVS